MKLSIILLSLLIAAIGSLEALQVPGSFLTINNSIVGPDNVIVDKEGPAEVRDIEMNLDVVSDVKTGSPLMPNDISTPRGIVNKTEYTDRQDTRPEPQKSNGAYQSRVGGFFGLLVVVSVILGVI